jgi:hypothetical protein
MLIPLLKVYQDAPDGLFPLVDNSRTQDTAVGPSGVHHLVSPPPSATGVVQRLMLVSLATCTLIVVMRTTPPRLARFVFVPSGV